MHVSMAMLANYATVDGDGLLHVNGGVWEYVERPVFPCTITGFLVAVLELDTSELGVEHSVEVVVVDQDGQDVGSSSRIVIVSNRYRTPLVASFSMVMSEPGSFRVEARDTAGVLTRVECLTRLEA